MKTYTEFWEKNGLDYITPPDNETPEGFDVGKTLKALIPFTVLEIGCGTGRIAQYFPPSEYVGIDINAAALEKARERCPRHSFILSTLESPLPVRDTALLYTVALHIPDDIIESQLARVSYAAPHIVIAEIMNPKYREQRAKGLQPGEYDVSNQRSLGQYAEIMAGLGFRPAGLIVRPYAHYPGESMTFASFRKA